MERYFVLGKYNTWYDWGLYLTAKDVTPPEPKTNYVELDGKHGTLDLTEALTGEVVFKDRTVTATFWTCNGTHADRCKLIKKITTALHGRKIKIIEPDDPDHYFYGRVTVGGVNNILPYLEFTITATCEPWRYSNNETVRYITTDSEEQRDYVFCNYGTKTVCPEMTVTGTVLIESGEWSQALAEGNYKILNLAFKPGVTVVRISGHGVIAFKYREADL